MLKKMQSLVEERESRNKCDACEKERRAKKCNEKPRGSGTQTKEGEGDKKRKQKQV